jgi:ABC-2 type transport system ATP-binding protein
VTSRSIPIQNPSLSIQNLTVRYGRRTAVDGASLTVERGAVYALLGRNGAGKSSLVRCLLGQQKPEGGSIAIFGDDAWRKRASLMERVGVVSEEADAPAEMTVAALTAFSSRLYQRWDAAAADERLGRFRIAKTAKFGDLSKGQKKQVSLALALASSPELLVLDDPTLGLDVVARRSLFEEVIADLADRGTTIFLTTHDLAGVETIADRIGILLDGRLVLDEELEPLKQRFRRIRFAAQPVALESSPLVATAVRAWGGGSEAIVSNYDELAFERYRSTSNVPGADVSAMSLEEIFIAVAGEQEGKLS